jgi:hypothetical protein
MTFLMTLDLCGCSKLTNLPLGSIFSSKTLQFFIFIDLSFCNISEVPDAIGELRGLERLNLQGNNFTRLPLTIQTLSSLSYLNLSHCHRLQVLPWTQTESGPSDSVGRYFKTKSGSRDHRSGLYVFDCPKLEEAYTVCQYTLFKWLKRLVKVRIICLPYLPPLFSFTVCHFFSSSNISIHLFLFGTRSLITSDVALTLFFPGYGEIFLIGLIIDLKEVQ